MSVQTVKARIYDLLASIEGIVTTYSGTLRNADLFPSFTVFTGDATSISLGSGLVEERRNYTLRLMVGPFELGDTGEMELISEPFYERVYTLFDNRPGLGYPNAYNALDGVQASGITSDTGLQTLELAGRPLVVIDFNLEVVEYVEVTPGA
jgi:hypothetical protein